MDFGDILGPNPIVVDLRAQNRWEAIDELVNQLVAAHKIKAEDRDAITASVKKRETSMSTGIGFGIGLPHATIDLVSELVAAVGRSKRGVQFDAVDGKLVNLVVLVLIPRGGFQMHLHTMANLAKLLHRADFRDGRWDRLN